MSKVDDPYQVLGITERASKDDVRRAFRAAAKECHPDLFPDNAVKAERFKRLSWAHALLTDDGARRRHDIGQRAKRRPGRHAQTNSTANDQKAGGRFRFPGINGADVRYTISVSAEEATSGTRKPIQTTDGRELRVTVPAGTRDGHSLRLRGQGLPGKFGGKSGDALIAVLVDLPADFSRDGSNVHCDVDIPLAMAVLGGKVEVPTIDGSVNLTIPAGSNGGDILRLRGRGTLESAGARGDQFVHVRLVLPDPRDPRLMQMLRDWAADAMST